MIIIEQAIYATLTGPGGVVLDHGDTLRVGSGINRPWSWSAKIFGATGFDYRHARSSTYAVTLHDGLGNTLSCPPLVAVPREKVDPFSISEPGVLSLSGIDLASWKMAVRNQSFPSFRATNSGALMAALAARAGVTLSATHTLPSWEITAEEVKGEKLADAVARVPDKPAYDYWIDGNGELCFGAWEESAGALLFVWSNRRNVYDPSQIYTGRRYGKRSAMNPATTQFYPFDHAQSVTVELQAPMLDPGCYQAYDFGVLGAVQFYAGDPGAGGGALPNKFFSFHPDYGYSGPTTGTGPATHMTVTTRPIPETGITEYPLPMRLAVTGTPYGTEGLPAGVDLAFLYPPNNTDPEDPESYDSSLGEWPYESNDIDTLYQGLGQVTTRYAQKLAMLSAAGDQEPMEGPLQVQVAVRQRATIDGRSYKLAGWEHDCASKKTTLEVVKV